MKSFKLILGLGLLFAGISSTLVGCGNHSSSSQVIEQIDYASQLKFDENSGRISAKVTVKNLVDGDTTHFNCDVPEITTAGVLKARYLGIDTPESTGKVEPYGKKASNFTKEKLTSATEIIVESDDGNWNADSTGTRYLLWVWYRTNSNEDFRLLNLEIMQAGLAMGKNIGKTAYAEMMQKAYSQALALKLNVYSGEDDPDYYYGSAQPVDLKEIRENIDSYVGSKVQFYANVTRVAGQTAYVEEYYEEENRSYGIAAYMGFDVNVQNQFAVGNRMQIVGNIEYYETGGSYQISNLTYMAMKPDYEDNVKIVEKGIEIVPTPITADELINEGDLLMSTNVSMENLTVKDVYVTQNGGDNDGAMTLTCQSEDGKSVKVRTSVLYHDDKTMVTKDELLNKTISINGIVDTFDGEVQVHVFVFNDITFIK